MTYDHTRSFKALERAAGYPLIVYYNGEQVWPVCADGAWPENADFPLGYDERDAKGV